MNALVNQAVELRVAVEKAGGLAGIADLARRWGISGEAVRKLAARPTFPTPIAVVFGRPVYAVVEADGWRHELEAARDARRAAA